MDHDSKYTIAVRDRTFTLTKSQIEFDSPNYFTTCFFGDFREAETRRLELFRDPDLFRIIIDHLCGYTVLPLSEKLIPAHMSLATALINLRADAVFYQLDGLIRACDEFSTKHDPTSKEKYLAVLGLVRDFDRVETASLFANDMSGYSTVFISPDQLTEAPFLELIRPNTDYGPVGFGGLRILAAVEHVLAYKLGEDYRRTWRLVGWGMEQDANDTDSVTYEMVILVERNSGTPNTTTTQMEH